MDDDLESLRWNEDDTQRYDIEIDQIGELVFSEENQPLRLWDLAHFIKNLPRKVHDAGECTILICVIIYESYNMSNHSI